MNKIEKIDKLIEEGKKFIGNNILEMILNFNLGIIL